MNAATKFLLMCGISLAMNPLRANDPEKMVQANIEAVKIHLQGAEVTHRTSVALSAGRQKLIFTDISPKFYEKTIQVSFTGGVKILSISCQTDFLNRRKDSPKIQQLRDSVDIIKSQIQQHADELESYRQEKAMLEYNRSIKGQDNDLSIENLQKAADFFRQRMLSIHQAITKINDKVEILNKRLFDIKLQMYELNANQTPLAEIQIIVEAPSALTSNIDLRYIVGDAGWASIYDLKGGELGKPIQLGYRGLAYNNTGVDWKDVKLSLSTADPLESSVQPTLGVWNINNANYGSIGNTIASEQGRYNNNNAYKNNDLNPNFNNKFNDINRNRSYQSEYLQLEQQQKQSARDIMKEDWNGNVDYDSESFRAWQARNKPKPDIGLTTIDAPELNAEFEMDRKYTIPSDKKPYSIDIASHSLPAEYRYLTIPKIDQDVFLIARLTDWEELDLISGPVNIFNGDKFITQSYLNTNSLSDTLYVSLGRDQDIVVKRMKVKNSSKKQFLGAQKKISLAYEISVRNNRSMPIDIEIQDQVPISDDKDVTVTVDETGKSEYDAKTGFLIWKTTITPSESKTFNFGFSVKFPKERVIRVEYSNQRKMAAPKF